MTRSPVTLKDVAKAAGVALSTASQVLRGSESSWVSEATKERIREAARRLGYRPNPAARLLASHRGHYFAVVLTRLNDPTLQEPVRTIVTRVLAAGYVPFVIETRDMAWRLYDNIESLADAAVFIGRRDKEVIARVNQFAGPASVVSTALLGTRFPEFTWSEEEGFDRILAYLEGLGHCRVALLGGGAGDGNRRRVGLYQAACRRRGWEELVVWCEEEKDPIQAGREMAVRLLGSHPEVTAVVGRNVEFSVGALAELQRRGLRVPRDISVVSFADGRIASGVYPGLTVLRTPVQEAAARAVEATLAMLRGESVECEATVLQTEMVLRESAAPPRGA